MGGKKGAAPADAKKSAPPAKKRFSFGKKSDSAEKVDSKKTVAKKAPIKKAVAKKVAPKKVAAKKIPVVKKKLAAKRPAAKKSTFKNNFVTKKPQGPKNKFTIYERECHIN